MPLLDLILGYDCNLGCTYCTITPAMRQRALAPGAAIAALRAGRDAGLTELSITGGEPTIFAHLLPIVRAAAAHGFTDIKVQSNGLMWAQTDNVRRAVAAGVTRFAVSIHSHRPAHYERIVRRNGVYDAMVGGLRNLVGQGHPVSADVIMMRETLPELSASIDWLAELGVRAADLWFVSLTDGNAANVASMPSMGEAVAAMRGAFERADARGVVLRSLHIPRCLLGDERLRAFDPASVGVRVVTPDATFDLARSRITGQVQVPACQGCPEQARCPGLREDYLARFGDAEIAKARGQTPTRRGRVKLAVAPSAATVDPLTGPKK